MFSIDGLTMIYGDRILFQGVSFHFSSKRRYGLVGANGAGKTTFLKIVSGSLEPSRGNVQIPKEARVGILDQDYYRFGAEPVLDVVMMGDTELWKVLKRKEVLLGKEKLTDRETEEISEIESKLSMQGGYRAEAKAAQLLSGLGIETKRHGMALDTLSGGYKLRVLLAQVLFVQPEILLLDEPTNYLDLFSIRWLERYLIDYPGTVILSSHDRFFLNRVCQEILDIDYAEMRRYIGNFDHFLQEKSKGIVAKESQLESFAKRKKDIQRFITRFKAKASKARQAGSRERMIEKLEEEEKEYQLLPSTRQYPHFQFTYARPSGQRALVAKDLTKSFGEHSVLKGVSFEVERFEKVAIVGPNGMGKSTLIEMLTNNIASDQGGSRWGPHVKWGYFPQNFHRILSKDMTLYDWISGVSKGVSDQKVRQILGQMLFDEHAVRKKIGALSGGEGARLVFAHLMLSEQNFLILDEPTNHLDMESVDALIQALKEYKGTLVMVSHNRYFISEVANRIIELRPTGLVDFQGGYQEFVEEHERDYLDQIAPKTEGKQKNYEEKKEERKERNRLKRDIERLEKEIANSEAKIEKVNEQLAAPGFYEQTPPSKQQEVINQKDVLERKRECDLNSWEDKMGEFSIKYLK
ncbi:ribosomal protection-like ABC-F family protein [Candidatus Neptunichlamydia sp. REUL1]|uniref:ribosomal protection-like ABC-F family protein n=1 Tax=Candidatus Neptunichlamydia sp. REUL1 TaxID=3064277 RepID=UPI00292DE499|nr:ABC-F family ATP-binding cassette domain-containing protein [Candidatus Neptunochlamydia sp. REUL1]